MVDRGNLSTYQSVLKRLKRLHFIEQKTTHQPYTFKSAAKVRKIFEIYKRNSFFFAILTKMRVPLSSRRGMHNILGEDRSERSVDKKCTIFFDTAIFFWARIAFKRLRNFSWKHRHFPKKIDEALQALQTLHIWE